MKIALVHDYIKEYGGAERVLSVLHEMFPQAPIYTAFVSEGSAKQEFEKVNAKLIPSWLNFILKYKNAHSALRFFIPFVWESFDFSKFDVVILSSSGYLTKPIRIPKNVKVFCYCHTPSRFLYGYETSVEWKRYPIVKIYGYLIGHFLRLYDWLGAQRVDQFISNSNNVAKRIKKFYRKDSIVIYPPVNVTEIASKEDLLRGGFYLVASRLVGEKGLPMVMDAANKLNIKLKIVGEKAGLQWENNEIEKRKSKNIEFLGRVTDEELYKLYASCRAFIVLEKDVDFGITPVEAMAAGTPVIAFKNGGYLETVVENKTGVFFEEYNVESLIGAIKKFNNLKFKKEDCVKQAQKFSKEVFVKNIKRVILEPEGR